MAKKDIGFQFAVLSMAIGFFIWLAFSNETFTNVVYSAIIKAYRPVLLVLAGILGIPPLIALILQASSKDKEDYDDKHYYSVLKGIIHLVFSVLIILIMAVVFAYLFSFLQLFSLRWIAFIISSVIIICLYYLLWAWLKRKFGLNALGFFSY
ncbi:MAG TPA: hypothetical protein VJH65_00390 [Candidatus Nanoarchaeia archaeon]|nr:hypothetical protein [Candidatus Nanoarchaeia archaeon]